jgi:hypothetical protein
MSDFSEAMGERQALWRADHVSTQRQGSENGLQHRWILPMECWEEGLWRDLRSGGSCPVEEYLRNNAASKHTGVNNLKSSWVSGVNTYFPFGATPDGRAMLASFLRHAVDPRIESVDLIELEFAEDPPLSPEALLGEVGGSRGSGQTSPDIGLRVNNGHGLVLVENKLTEHSFYRCSARTKKGSDARPANPDLSRCERAVEVAADPSGMCQQQTWGRRYWELLQNSTDREQLAVLSCCPAARSGYQLFRQQALAEGIALSGRYDFVVSCVALDARNSELQRCLASTGIRDVREWGALFKGSASFAVWTHQEWVAWVRTNDSTGEWTEWAAWMSARYGF